MKLLFAIFFIISLTIILAEPLKSLENMHVIRQFSTYKYCDFLITSEARENKPGIFWENFIFDKEINGFSIGEIINNVEKKYQLIEIEIGVNYNAERFDGFIATFSGDTLYDYRLIFCLCENNLKPFAGAYDEECHEFTDKDSINKNYEQIQKVKSFKLYQLKVSKFLKPVPVPDTNKK